jgi:hypothetical protein
MLAKAAKMAPATSTISTATQSAVRHRGGLEGSKAESGMAGSLAQTHPTCQQRDNDLCLPRGPAQATNNEGIEPPAVDSSVFYKITINFENVNC